MEGTYGLVIDGYMTRIKYFSGGAYDTKYSEVFMHISTYMS